MSPPHRCANIHHPPLAAAQVAISTTNRALGCARTTRLRYMAPVVERERCVATGKPRVNACRDLRDEDDPAVKSQTAPSPRQRQINGIRASPYPTYFPAGHMKIYDPRFKINNKMYCAFLL
ncbi:hypothetical protein PPMP20_33210 [Paraburkholderia phymatum]|uniref:hypothetical protein n=1 Tax=Paraburkholderia phymatum TaxID=148447 RepID=UPI0000E78ECF|nr:hypothetical protein [Paraburkholderia phymatum]